MASRYPDSSNIVAALVVLLAIIHIGPSCASELEVLPSVLRENGHRRMESLLEKRFHIQLSEFSHTDYSIDLTYSVSDYIRNNDTLVRAFSMIDCESDSVIDETVGKQYLSVETIYDNTAKGNGQNTRRITVEFTINPALIIASPIFKQSDDNDSSEPTTQMAFCTRFSIMEPESIDEEESIMALEEANFRETRIFAILDETDGNRISSVRVEDKPKYSLDTLQHAVKAYQCNSQLKPIVGEEPLTLGEEVRICVAPDGKDTLGQVFMNSIVSFSWRTDDAATTTATITEEVIADGQPTDDGTTLLNCQAGQALCTIETIMMADFFAQGDGMVIGEGYAKTQIGNEAATVETDPKTPPTTPPDNTLPSASPTMSPVTAEEQPTVILVNETTAPNNTPQDVDCTSVISPLNESYGGPIAEPIEVLDVMRDSTDQVSISYNVRQTWKRETGVHQMAVSHLPIGQGALQCETQDAVAWLDHLSSYTSHCYNGLTTVYVFLYDTTFSDSDSDGPATDWYGCDSQFMALDSFVRGFRVQIPCHDSCRTEDQVNKRRFLQESDKIVSLLPFNIQVSIHGLIPQGLQTEDQQKSEGGLKPVGKFFLVTFLLLLTGGLTILFIIYRRNQHDKQEGARIVKDIAERSIPPPEPMLIPNLSNIQLYRTPKEVI